MLKSPRGGYNYKTLETLGVVTPPKMGWKTELIGSRITLAKLIECAKASKNTSYLELILQSIPSLHPPVQEHHENTTPQFAAPAKIADFSPSPNIGKKKKKAEKQRYRKKIANENSAMHRIRSFGVEKILDELKALNPHNFTNRPNYKIKDEIRDYLTPPVSNQDALRALKGINDLGINITVRSNGKAIITKHQSKKAIKKSQVIYVIRVKGSSSLKIGISIDPKKRLAALQTSNPRKLYVDKIYDTGNINSSRVERDLHKAFKAHALEGEWFSSVSAEDIFDALPHEAQEVALTKYFK